MTSRILNQLTWPLGRAEEQASGSYCAHAALASSLLSGPNKLSSKSSSIPSDRKIHMKIIEAIIVQTVRLV